MHRLWLIVCMMALGGGVVTAQQLLPTRAGTTIVFGFNDGAEANAPGEVTFTLSGVVTGTPGDSLVTTDTIMVDTGYCMSLLPTPINQAATSYDTVYFQYHFQNQSNLASDSFSVLAYVIDTSNSGGFIPTDFDICSQADSSVISINPSGDSAWYFKRLASGAVDSMLLRIVIPSPDSAADQDSISIVVTLSDNNGLGTNDNWPGLVGNAIRRVILDTAGIYLNTNTDTLWDYGDTQYDTVRILVGGPLIRTKTTTTIASATQLPGDTLDYTLYYDNDGSAATEDTGYYVMYLPQGVAFLETLTTNPGDNAAGIKTYLGYNGTWLENIPLGNTIASRDSLAGINALKFAVAPGVAATAGDNMISLIADDSTGTDAGMIKFRVRIR